MHQYQENLYICDYYKKFIYLYFRLKKNKFHNFKYIIDFNKQYFKIFKKISFFS